MAKSSINITIHYFDKLRCFTGSNSGNFFKKVQHGKKYKIMSGTINGDFAILVPRLSSVNKNFKLTDHIKKKKNNNTISQAYNFFSFFHINYYLKYAGFFLYMHLHWF